MPKDVVVFYKPLDRTGAPDVPKMTLMYWVLGAIATLIQELKAAALKAVEDVSLASLEIKSKALVVSDEDSYKECISLMNKFGGAEKQINAVCDPICKGTDRIHDSLTGVRKEVAGPYIAGKALCKYKAEAYQLALKKAKREAEEALARATEAEQRRLREESEALMAKGFVKQAQNAYQQSEFITAACTLPDVATRTPGARVGDKWTPVVYDLSATIRSIAEGKTPLMWDMPGGEPEPLVKFNERVLAAIARRSGSTAQIPGVRFDEGSRVTSSRLG